MLNVDPVRLNSAQGAVSGSLRIDGRSAQAYPLSIQADVKGIRIDQLFREFRDFGQTFITYQHLQGKGDVRLMLTASLSPTLKLDQNSLHCLADMRIDQELAEMPAGPERGGPLAFVLPSHPSAKLDGRL